jgi:hypothetical protein
MSQRTKGGRFRRGGCADMCQGMGKKENEIQSNQPILTFLNHTIPKSHSKIFENDWLDWIGWFKLKQKTANPFNDTHLHLSGKLLRAIVAQSRGCP